MKCQAINEEKINQYIDAEINNYEKNCLEEHFLDCKGCRDHFKELKTVISEIRNDAFEADEPPARLWSRINARLSSVRKKKFVWHLSLIPAMVTMVFFVVFFLSGEKAKSDVNTYMQLHLSYLSGDTLINRWYLDNESTDVVAVFLNDKG